MPYMKVEDKSLYYDTEGQGIPIMFIHPPLLTSTNFVYQKQLASNFQCISFDIRGHGYSDCFETPLTYAHIVDDMIQLLDVLAIKKCYVCGYSTGGSIALEAMITNPHRFYGGILISAMSEVNDWWLRARISTAATLAGFRLKRLLSLAITSGNADNIPNFKNLFGQAKQGNVENMAQYYRFSKSYNCTAKLSQINLPQLLIYGHKDKGFYRYAKLLERELPSNELYFIRDIGHQIPTKASEKMNRLMKQWIEKQQINV